MSDPQSRRLPVFDQLDEPSVVHMATQVAGFDVAMPEAGNQQKSGDYEQLYPMLGNEPYSPRKRSNFSLRFNGRMLFLRGSRKRYSGAKKQIWRPIPSLSSINISCRRIELWTVPRIVTQVMCHCDVRYRKQQRTDLFV